MKHESEDSKFRLTVPNNSRASMKYKGYGKNEINSKPLCAVM